MKLGFGRVSAHVDPCLLCLRAAGGRNACRLVDYFKGRGSANLRQDQPDGELAGWGHAGDPNQLWSVEEMREIKREIQDTGLIWETIENFDPAHWYDVLLAPPFRPWRATSSSGRPS
jgi:mannonate dehydratase